LVALNDYTVDWLKTTAFDDAISPNEKEGTLHNSKQYHLLFWILMQLIQHHIGIIYSTKIR